MSILIQLFVEFFKVGLFAIGGGLASIPFLTEISQNYGWYTLEDLTTMIAVSESTPGPLGVNMATYVGYIMDGIPGALVATIALILPSIIIVSIIARNLHRFRDSRIVQAVFAGLKPAVIAFIISACLDIFLTTMFHMDHSGSLWGFFNFSNIFLLALLLVISNRFPKIHPILFIVCSACVGIVFSL